MIVWNDAVTDRTSYDTSRVIELTNKIKNNTITQEEMTEWLAGLKGALNKSDLERIENNVQLLSDVLELDLPTYVDNIPDLPDESYYLNLVNNVQALRESAYIRRTTPQTPQQPINTYTKWNDIEKILQDIFEILHNNFYYYCGSEIYAGEEFGLLL